MILYSIAEDNTSMQVDHTSLDNEHSSMLFFLPIITPTSSVLFLLQRLSLHHRSRRGVALRVCNAEKHGKKSEIDKGKENVKHGNRRWNLEIVVTE